MKKLTIRRRNIIYIVAILTLTLTVIAWYNAQNIVKYEVKEYVNDHVDEFSLSIDLNTIKYVNTLYGLRALFAASKFVERNEWKEYITKLNVETRFPGIVSFEFTRYVKQVDKNKFEYTVRNDTSLTPKGYPDFAVYPKGERKEYYVVDYIEPFEENMIVFGYDRGIDPVRLEAMKRALESGLPVASKTIQLKRRNNEPGVLLLMPIYKKYLSHRTKEEQQFAIEGFVTIVIHINQLMKTTFSNRDFHEFVLVISEDNTNIPVNNLLYVSDKDSFDKVVKSNKDTHIIKPLNICGQNWYLHLYARPGVKLAPSNSNPLMVLLSGFCISLVLLILTWIITMSEQRAVQLADDMTVELNIQNKKLQDAVNNWAATYNAMIDGVSIHSADNNILIVNDAMCELLSKSRAEIVGKKCYEIFHNSNAPIALCQAKVSMSVLKTTHDEWYDSLLAKWLSVYISPIFDSKGNVERFVHVIRDITERKYAENVIIESMRVRSQFISAVSHELRTPLTSIKEGIGLVLDGTVGEINAEQKELLEISKSDVDRLHRLINDVLDFSKLESQKTEFKIQEGNLNDLVKRVAKSMERVIQKKGLDLKLDLDNSIGNIQFDYDRITQVMNNLFNNAVKFTEQGTISVSTVYDKDKKSVAVHVKDTGMGISETDITKLFKEFQQVGTFRKTGGTGLGLAISRQIIEGHSGKIWAGSVPGQGSEFVFTLPAG
ncbi:MAG: CHASE domain-containing protein [Elusimicrobiota bacterium]